ncbi:MAG TPA: LPS assembly protein LptD, partial [Pseudobdellovibrionaceae bacterium]
GIIYNGFVQSGPVVFSGSILQKASEEEYYVSDADYTTCTNCPPTWGFSGSNIRAVLGGYAYIKNSFLKIYSVPVFWLPYLIVPLKSDRQTGFLTPRLLGDQAGGLALSESFFWAISRSTDATFALTNYEKRGLKGSAEYRYLLNENSHGTFNAAALVDHVFRDDLRVTNFEKEGEKGKDITRWYAKYDHYYDLPNGYIQRAQINIASDLQYPKDFSEETLNHGDPAMENRISLTKNSFDQHFSVDTSYYVNLLQSDPLASNSNSVHRIPEIRFSQTQQKISNSQFLFSYDLDYVNFARSGPSFDKLDTDNGVSFEKNSCRNPKYDQYPNCHLSLQGKFDPATDLLRTGQRIDMSGTIARPLNIGDYLNILPALSYRETDYQFNVGDERTNSRRYLRATLGAKTSISRVFILDEAPKADKYKHEIIPEVIATTIPWIKHPAHSFFGTGIDPDGTFYYSDYLTDADLASPTRLQFDYNDRIYDRGQVTFAVNNKLVQKAWVGDTPTYLQIASLKFFQSYDTYQANLRNPTREPWSDVTTILDVRLKHFQTYTILNYFPQQNVTNISSRVRINNDNDQFVQVSLTKTYKISPGVDVDPNSRVEDYAFAAGTTGSYINFMGKFVYDANWANTPSHKRIKEWAYMAQIKPPGDCWAINLIQYFPTDGNTKTFVDFVFNFDGTPKPPLPTENLNLYGF